MDFTTINGVEGMFFDQIEDQLGAGWANEFLKWMRGQTHMVVNGLPFYYREDMERFMRTATR